MTKGSFDCHMNSHMLLVRWQSSVVSSHLLLKNVRVLHCSASLSYTNRANSEGCVHVHIFKHNTRYFYISLLLLSHGTCKPYSEKILGPCSFIGPKLEVLYFNIYIYIYIYIYFLLHINLDEFSSHIWWLPCWDNMNSLCNKHKLTSNS